MKETALTAKILTYLHSQGCYAVKWHGSVYGAGGMPDIYVLVPSRPYAIPIHIEVKLPGNTPTPRQEKVLRDLRKAGAVAVWVDNLRAVQQLIEKLKEEGHAVAVWVDNLRAVQQLIEKLKEEGHDV